MTLPTNLVLLPPAPCPATYANVKAAYHAPLLLALKIVQQAHESSTLDIVLPFPDLYASGSRATHYASTQEAVANLYKLVCVIASQQKIELSSVDGNVIDVRVVLLAYPRDGNVDSRSFPFGPVVDLTTLARCGRPWVSVLSVETEQGEKLLRNFSTRAATSYPVKKLRGGIVTVSPSSSGISDHICQSVAVGGTFDHLHIGHKLLLTMTCFALDFVNENQVLTCGITAAQLLEKKKYAEVLESWSTRMKKTAEFIKAIMYFSPVVESVEEIHNDGPNGHAIIVNTRTNGFNFQQRYVEIWDPFGPTITDAGIDTIVVSGETSSGGKMVNDKRLELDMKILQVFEVDVLDALEESSKDFQAKLSSTDIRKAQVDRLKQSKV